LSKLNKEKINYFLKEKYFFQENKKLKLTNAGVLVIDFILSEIL
jgi:hypothetical protein